VTSNFVKSGLIIVIILLAAILGSMTGFVTRPNIEPITTTSYPQFTTTIKPTYCGDGICQSNENCLNCLRDCENNCRVEITSAKCEKAYPNEPNNYNYKVTWSIKNLNQYDIAMKAYFSFQFTFKEVEGWANRCYSIYSTDCEDVTIDFKPLETKDYSFYFNVGYTPSKVELYLYSYESAKGILSNVVTVDC
jgi:hypothetical protein